MGTEKQQNHIMADWHFTTDSARIQLKRLPPRTVNDLGH